MVEIGFDGHQTLTLYQSAKSVSDKILIRPASHQMALASQLGAVEFYSARKVGKGNPTMGWNRPRDRAGSFSGGRPDFLP
jgi:hypothetical protein